MELKEAFQKLKQSKNFLDWKKNNPNDFFYYAFCQEEGPKKSEWQLGYFNQEKEKATSFLIGNEIEILPPEEVFKKPEEKIKNINPEEIKIEYKKAVEISKQFQTENFPQELISKIIIILQNLKGLGDVWNITIITKTLKTLNLKINPQDGKIIEHKLTNLMDFVQKQE